MNGTKEPASAHNSTFLIDTLGGKAATVEDLLDMSEPARNSQSRHPLIGRGVHIGAGLHEFRVGVEEKVVTIYGLADPLPSWVIDFALVSAPLLSLRLRCANGARVRAAHHVRKLLT